jgi:multidrug efflux system outer membrane protein
MKPASVIHALNWPPTLAREVQAHRASRPTPIRHLYADGTPLPVLRPVQMAGFRSLRRISPRGSLALPLLVALFTEFSNLFTGPACVWSFAGAVSLPIFTAGNIEGQVHQAQARQQEALSVYQKAIQTASQEVADALITLQKSREQLSVQYDQVAALSTYAHLARLRYEGGYTSYIEVLDAERSLFNAQLSYAQTQGAELTSFVSLYKAMGGGWVVKAEQMTQPPASQPMAGGPPAAEAPK